jgi:hypothetical protein
LYAIIAVVFFPYEAPPKPLPKGAIHASITPRSIADQEPDPSRAPWVS